MDDLIIKIEPNLISFNGIEIKNSITENKLIRAIGEPDREINFRKNYLLYNGTYVYDRYGMTISFNHGEGSYMTLYYSLKSSLHYYPETTPYNIFHGSLTINGFEIPKTDNTKNKTTKEYNTKFKQTIAAFTNVRGFNARDSFFTSIDGTRIHFQFDYKTMNKIEAAFLTFESGRKRRKKLPPTAKYPASRISLLH